MSPQQANRYLGHSRPELPGSRFKQSSESPPRGTQNEGQSVLGPGLAAAVGNTPHTHTDIKLQRITASIGTC